MYRLLFIWYSYTIYSRTFFDLLLISWFVTHFSICHSFL